MARKHSARTTSGGLDGAAAAPARALKPARSKRAEVELEAGSQDAVAAPALDSTSEAPVSEHDEIARLAYLYYEARGGEDGSPEDDWLRAEAEFRSRR